MIQIFFFILKTILCLTLVIINIFLHENIHLKMLKKYDGAGYIIYNILHPRVVITNTTQITKQNKNIILLSPYPIDVIIYTLIMFIFLYGWKLTDKTIFLISIFLGFILATASGYYDIKNVLNTKMEMKSIYE